MEIITRTRTFEKYTAKEIKNEVVQKATIVIFEDGEFEEPELVFWKNRKIRISDNRQGLAEWSDEKNGYVRHFYGSTRPLGKLKEILIEVTP